jgi:GxxExxY protein
MLDDLTYEVIGAAIEVHKEIGPGLLESIYEKCFLQELALRNINFRDQLVITLQYKGLSLNSELRLDILVEDILCVELKAIEGLLPIHDAIILCYMKMLQKPKGILINFHCNNIFKSGQKTFANSLYSNLVN